METYTISDFSNKIINHTKFLYRHYRKNKIARVRNGLPLNLDQRVINNISRNQFDSEIRTAKFQKLSGWKKTGTYRLFLTLQDNRKKQLIYRHCSYNHKDFPALKGYPVELGPVEYEIGNNSSEELNSYLPRTYWLDHDEQDVYRYIVEDLTTSDYKARLALDESIVYHLVSLNRALNRSNMDITVFPKYDITYSRNLVSYITDLWDKSWDKKYNLSFQKIKKITELYLEIAGHEKTLHLIHGDFNESNILFKFQNGRYHLKIVDWEWAGMGIIHSDLAAYFRSARHPHLEAGLNKLALLQPRDSFDYHYKWMYWALMDRALLDLSYMIAQRKKAKKYSTFNIDRFIHESVMNLSDAYAEMQHVFKYA